MNTTKIDKPYIWKDIVSKLNISIEDNIRNNQYRYAEQYFRNFYFGDNEKSKFSEADVKFILEEIIDEAEHKIRLYEMDERQKQLKKDWPDVDLYIENIINRGPLRGEERHLEAGASRDGPLRGEERHLEAGASRDGPYPGTNK